MFKIGEFSKLVRVSARMLRYYDKNGIFVPAEVDRFTGYRLYSSKQVPLLMKIVTLRDMGFGVEEIEEILSHYEDSIYMQKVLTRKRQEIENTIITEQFKLDQITFMSESLKEIGRMVYEVELKEIPSVSVLSLRKVIAKPENEFEQWDEMLAFITKHNIDVVQNAHSIYHDTEHKDSEVDIEIAFPVTTKGIDMEGFVFKELPAMSNVATISFPLPYINYNTAMQKLTLWLEEHNYQIDGLVRGVAKEEGFVELQVSIKESI